MGGKQLISRGWIEESTRADASTDPSSEYQYFWWINTPDGGGTSTSRPVASMDSTST